MPWPFVHYPFTLAMALAALAACTAQPAVLTPEGERVMTLEDERGAAGCDELAPITAPEEQLRSANARTMVELRNRTGARGGNRLLAGGPGSYGRVEFRVFRCP